MAKNIVGMYRQMEDAHKVIQDLVDSGFSRDDISLLAKYMTGEITEETIEQAKREQAGREGKGEEVGTGAAIGAGTGAVLGGLGGLVVGLGLVTIPGIGPLLAAGALATTLAGVGVGAVAGGLIGALAGLGIPEEEARVYERGIQEGNVLVVVKASDEMANRAADIMNRYNPINVERQAAEWGVERREAAVTGAEVEEPMRTEAEMKEPTQMEEEMAVGEREEAVAEKRARVMEEVEIEEEVEERPETVQGTVRRTDVEVEHMEPGRTAAGLDISVQETFFRNHFQTTYGTTAYTYDQFRPYYAYGYDLGMSERYRSRTWQDVEPEFRRDFERRYPDARWDEYRDAIQTGWDRARANR